MRIKKLSTFERRLRDYRGHIAQLVIADRHIIGALNAVFSLRGPPDSMIGLTCVSVLPCHHVAIVGDMTTMVFATYGNNTWRGALGRFYRADGDAFSYPYVREKGATGMSGFDIDEYDKDTAIRDLASMFRSDRADNDPMDRRFPREVREELYSLAEDGEGQLYERLYDIDSDILCDGIPPGQTLRRNAIAGALIMNHITKLLDAEDARSEAAQ